MLLPRPNRDYGYFELEDGSRIYPSSHNLYKDPPQFKFFLWVKEGTVKEGKSNKVLPVGHIILHRQGIVYFDSPEDALNYYAQMNKTYSSKKR